MFVFCLFFSWYFGKVSRQASEDWLLSPGYPKGTYLVRQGEAAPDTYTLSVRDCDELRGYIVKHYKIHTQREPQTAFQAYFITPRKQFRTLDELVNHYSGLLCFSLLIKTRFGSTLTRLMNVLHNDHNYFNRILKVLIGN